jgi:hypothetical protein
MYPLAVARVAVVIVVDIKNVLASIGRKAVFWRTSESARLKGL